MGTGLLHVHTGLVYIFFLQDHFSWLQTAVTREGTTEWKWPLCLCMDYCAVSHSTSRKWLLGAQGLDNLPQSQLFPDLHCPAFWLLLAEHRSMEATLARLPPFC